MVTMVCTACGHGKAVRQGCKQKWCPVCVRAIAAKRAAKYQLACSLMQWPMHVTLTEPNRDRMSLDSIKKLNNAFTKLRHQRLWTERVKGGIAGTEVTHTGNGYHIHKHAAIDCEWLAWKTPKWYRTDSSRVKREKFKSASQELGIGWAKCLGIQTYDLAWSGVIYKVRRCSPEHIAHEILKYAVKGSDLVECEGQVGDLIRAMKFTRLTTSFGSMFGKVRVEDGTTREPCSCEKCQQIGSFVPQAVADSMMRRSHVRR